MSGSLNKCLIIGNLGKDPEVRSMQNGGRVCNLSVATSESWVDKNSGERKEKTEWVRITIWNDHLVTIAEKYLRKGSKVYLEGALETRKWTDQQGVEKYSTEVVLKQYRGELVMLDGAKSADSGGGSYSQPAATPAPRSDAARKTEPNTNFELDDRIPF